MAASTDHEMYEKLLKSVKKEVKQIMEEAVTMKFVHEESSSITSLCGAVEACLYHGLKKRALGLFKNSTTTALLHKVSKNFEPAAQVVKVLGEIENNIDNAKKSLDSNKNQTTRKFNYNPRYLWIRLALFEKQLAKIIDFLVENCSKYYEKDALIADPVDGPILASLLVGPCALDYTKMKTSDHYWTDPPADELVQRHRIHSSGNHHIRQDSPKRPGLQVRRHTSSSSEENLRSTPLSAKEYVESLHQNSKSLLLYGKNNVIVQPKEDVAPLAGYLSLHQGPEGLTVKWTPNQLMNGCCQDEDQSIDRRPVFAKYALRRRNNGLEQLLYWDYAVTIYMDEVVYLHCHQQPDCGGTIVLVGQDGVQRPPIHFPKGGHLLAFLSCMENGLLPHGQLDPPLWSQRGKGKVFPRLKRKGSRLTESMVERSPERSQSMEETGNHSMIDDEETTDYVFRIIASFKPEHLPSEVIDPKVKEKDKGSPFPLRKKPTEAKSSLSRSFDAPAIPSSIQTYAKKQQAQNNTCIISKTGHRSAVKQLCDTMSRQILSRAFYGWLSHCRHLKTVRTHLSGLVNATLVSVDNPADASDGLVTDVWARLYKDGVLHDSAELYRLVYYGGCAHGIRKEVWPYLLGHYKFDSLPEDRAVLDENLRQQYEKTMSEWLAVEAIVRQRDKEIMAANQAKLSSESQDGHIPLVRKDSSLSNDVFLSVDSDDFSHPETVPEETSSAAMEESSNSATPTVEQMPVDVPVEKPHQGLASVQSTDSKETTSPDSGVGDSLARESCSAESRRSDSCDTDRNVEGIKSESEDLQDQKNIIITNPSIDQIELDRSRTESHPDYEPITEPGKLSCSGDPGEHLSASRESLNCPASPVSNASNGGVYSAEMLDNVGLNLHRIDKDVQRCDRNYSYFTPANLDKLRNVMCTYVWEHLEVGYVQGMCDLAAPLLVILDDESTTYGCFCQLMKRMSANFPHGSAMDRHFANMRSLIQILDPELFEHMHHNGDYTHFYFCYRWFLLDFKRELVYDDVFAVWETIWAARHISSPHFVLFIALALVEFYREIIMDNNMDFTDIIKFFNEMAEHHNSGQVLAIARDLVFKLQDLIEFK